MLEKPPTCAGCPAAAVGVGYVPGLGPTTASIALVGQGPGRIEALTGRPFAGPSGQVLDRWLAAAGIRRKDCWITNVVQCQLPGDRTPTKRERDYCTARHTYPELAALPNLRVVVPIGIPAAKALLGEDVGERSVCTLFTKENDFEQRVLRPGPGPSPDREPSEAPSLGGPELGEAPTVEQVSS